MPNGASDACSDGYYPSVRTARLDLRALTVDDLEQVYALHTDPRVWRHFPAGRHADRAQTMDFLRAAQRGWETDGLGYWAVRRLDATEGGFSSGVLLGVAGVARRSGPAWNTYYRFAPEAQGCGYAAEVVRAAHDAAAEVDPTIPVTAFLLEHNVSSRRAAERAGLRLVWRGRDVGNQDPHAVRLIYADRPLNQALIEEVAEHS